MALPRNADVMVWDNGGKTVDRYTVAIRGQRGFDIYTMSEDPSSPQGFNAYSHTASAFNDPEGKRMPLHKLPKKLLAAIDQRKKDMSENLKEEAETEKWMEVDGEKIDVRDVTTGSYLPMVELEDRTEWYIAEDSEAAGKAAMEYWKDMAKNDPKEMAALIGDEVLIQWGLGQPAGPGTSQVRSMKEWIELWEDIPEEQWASYDGNEVDVVLSQELADELGLEPGPAVAYRHN